LAEQFWNLLKKSTYQAEVKFMKKRTLVIAVAMNGLATLFLAKGIYAGVKVPEVIHTKK